MHLRLTVEPQLTNSFLDEFEKIAAKKKPKEKIHTPQELQKKNNRGMLGVGATLGANTLMGAAAVPFMKDKNVTLPDGPVRPPEPEFLQPRNHWNDPIKINPEYTEFQKRDMQGIINEHGDKGKDLRQIARADKVREQMGGIGRDELTYNMKSKMGPAVAVGGPKYDVHIPDNAKESIIGHELGHIKNDKMWGKVGRGINTASRMGSSLGALPAAFMAGYSDEPTWTPGLVQAGISAPMLIDEGLASARSVKHMVKQHGLWKGLNKSKVLAPAFGTYAAAATTPLAITAVRKHLKKKKEKAGK